MNFEKLGVPAYPTRQDIALQLHHHECVPFLNHPTQQGSKIVNEGKLKNLFKKKKKKAVLNYAAMNE